MNADLLSRRSSLSGIVRVPGSKSLTHRALVLSSLANGRSRLRSPLICDDTMSTVRGLRCLGVDIQQMGGSVSIEGGGGRFEAPSSPIDLGNSGTSLRFLTVLAGLATGTVILTGDNSLRSRPMGELLKCLRSIGVSARSLYGQGVAPVEVRGTGCVEGGNASIPGGVSSQFISAMLLPSARFEKGLELQVIGGLKSRPYVEMTVRMMRDWGVHVQSIGSTFSVSRGQTYLARDFEIEGDYSSAAFLIAASLVTRSEIQIEGLRRRTTQGDARFVRIAEKMGAQIRWRSRRLHMIPSSLRGIDIDLSDTPDLLPPLAAVACRAAGTTKIRGVEHARLKESDRISVLSAELGRLGANATETHDGLIISGTSTLKGGVASSHGDHRIAMSLAVVGLDTDGVLIRDADCISVSYPRFVEDLRLLGADIQWVGSNGRGPA